jgi:hypothetical protein
MGRRQQPLSEQWNVEPQRARASLRDGLFGRQKIKAQRRKISSVHFTRNQTVPRT